MNQASIFVPFVGTMLLTMVVWIYMYARRIPFITRSDLAGKPAVSNPSDNLKNLFELPTIFYAAILYLFVTQQVDTPYLVAAWVFFPFRVLHSIVHCTFNLVLLRFWLYAASALSLWFIVVRIAWHLLVGR